MSLNNCRETAWAWNRLHRMTGTEIAAARTRDVLDGLRYFAALVTAGVVLVVVLWLMRAL